MSINDVRATGTVVVGTVVDGDIVTVAGLAYTVVANATVIAGDYTKLKAT